MSNKTLAEQIADEVLIQYKEPWHNDRKKARENLIHHVESEIEEGESDKELLFDSAAEYFVEKWQNRE